MRVLATLGMGLAATATAVAAAPGVENEPVVARFVVATLQGLPYQQGDLDPQPSADVMDYLASLKGCKFRDLESLQKKGAVGISWDCGRTVKMKYNAVVIYVENGKINKILPSDLLNGD